MRPLILTQNITADGSIEMLDDWFDPMAQDADQAQIVARDSAARNLTFTTVRAPYDGVIGNLSVQPGDLVSPSRRLASIVPLDRVYIDANFKETQLDRLRLGQTVEIEADAFKGRALHGRIDSFAPATGSEFALIPVENATGNFTKITQRVPVRIVVQRDASGQPIVLRPGLSVEVKVDLKSQGGPAFAEAHMGETTRAEAGSAR